MISRETIYAALFAKGQAAAGFNQSARRLRHIEDLQPAEFPAFYQVQVQESWSQPAGNLPPIGSLHVEWWVYVFNGNPQASHGADMNPLVDALMSSLGLPPHFNPSLSGGQALGLPIESIRLDGQIQYAEGALDDRAFARIPLVIKLPG
jgi:hypothetical protein